jgi:hypothetical protein
MCDWKWWNGNIGGTTCSISPAFRMIQLEFL